mmetsp:Transcript_42013/g.84161  ORF Transcript_42013/g.84161 Transcript_42013/m.84161 type:complete len:203 (+) Transcript_42013:876-1484(+)
MPSSTSRFLSRTPEKALVRVKGNWSERLVPRLETSTTKRSFVARPIRRSTVYLSRASSSPQKMSVSVSSRLMPRVSSSLSHELTDSAGRSLTRSISSSRSGPGFPMTATVCGPRNLCKPSRSSSSSSAERPVLLRKFSASESTLLVRASAALDPIASHSSCRRCMISSASWFMFSSSDWARFCRFDVASLKILSIFSRVSRS